MKRLILVLALLIVTLISGCGRDYGILDYQSKNIKAECKINDKYTVLLTKDETGCKISISEPKEAEGICFEITESSATVATEDIKIEVDKEHLNGICAIASIFSQSEECLTGAWEQDGESILTFEQAGTHFQITLGDNSVPKRVKIVSQSFEYDIEICAIELT
ncbi:MAG: hypothetical protein IJ039_05360 [Clostridia bacterium]|nr:hypothetical protein [Clostridia bacterium]